MTDRKIAWCVNWGSTYITMVEWEWETEKYYCYHRHNGSVGRRLKHPVGTHFSYFPTWEEANAEVLRQAEADLASTINSLKGKQALIDMIKTRTKKTMYEL